MQEVLNEMHRDYSTSRGSQLLDGEALEKAKQQLKQAQKKGFSSIIERFDNDVDFTLHSVAGGFDHEFLAIEDVLTHSALQEPWTQPWCRGLRWRSAGRDGTQ